MSSKVSPNKENQPSTAVLLLRLVAVVGMVFSCIGVIGGGMLAFGMATKFTGKFDLASFLALLPLPLVPAALLVSFWRLYHLQRWAGVILVVFGWPLAVWQAMNSGGVWKWAAGWIVGAALVTIMVVANWRSLKSGV